MKQTRSFGALCGATCLLALSGGLLVHARAQVKVPSVPSNPDAIRDIGNMLREWSITFMAPDPRGGSSNYFILRSMRPNGTSIIDFWGTRTSLSSERGYPCGYALSPDGKTLIFSTYHPSAGTYSQQKGRPSTKIMDRMISNISISPDGRRILYNRGYEINNADIYTSNIDGTDERQLTNDLADEIWPNWSPDGRKILYSHVPGVKTRLMVMEADGSGKRAITESSFTDPSRINFSGGKWSPDGSKIVAIGSTVVSFVESLQVYTLNADGTSPRQLTTEAFEHRYPCWSPDGRKILYATKMGGTGTSKFDIFLMDADGTHQTNLTNTPDITESSPAWQAPIVSLPLVGR